ncbi:MAG: hypothetical protein ACK5KO_04205 [Arachnia sp.]
MSGFFYAYWQFFLVVAAAALLGYLLGWWLRGMGRTKRMAKESLGGANAGSHKDVQSARVRAEAPAEDSVVSRLRAQLKQRSLELAARDRELQHREEQYSRLETAAVTAWDATVPALEQRISELEGDARRLTERLVVAEGLLQAGSEQRHREAGRAS